MIFASKKPDHPQHNKPNPILTGIRDGENTLESAAAMLQEDAREWWNDLVITDEHIDHARRVLTRLANLTDKEH